MFASSLRLEFRVHRVAAMQACVRDMSCDEGDVVSAKAVARRFALAATGFRNPVPTRFEARCP